MIKTLFQLIQNRYGLKKRKTQIHLLTEIIKRHDYRKITPIGKGEFGRFHGVVSDIEGNKFFVKAAIGKKSYKYKSLRAEAHINRYLSIQTARTPLVYNGYRLQIPRVEKVIKQGEILCLICRYIEGDRLLDKPSRVQAELLCNTIELVAQLSEKTRRCIIQPYLKNYTCKALLLYFPLRLLKAIFLSPFATSGLIATAWNVLSFFRLGSYDCGLVHADVNASNILIYKKTIYLTDWEEAGWGITAYNTITPLCLYWENRTVRDKLLRSLQEKGLKKVIIPLLAYRTLALLGQKTGKKNIKRIRDLKLLRFVGRYSDRRRKVSTKMKQIKIFKYLSTTAFVAAILVFSIRGVAGNPSQETLNKPEFKNDGPFELSPERGKFALTYSIAENKSFQFSLPIARFVTPDLGYKDGKYVSLFVPGVSFLAIPGYLLGKSLGLAQVGTFAVISVFALLNVLLIRSIAIRLGANHLAATIGALIFLLATPAFAYAVTLYQHQVTVFLILASLYILIRWKNLWSLFLVWFLLAASILVDYPNFFMMFPIGIYALGRIIKTQTLEEKIKVKIKLAGLLTMLTILIPLGLFGWSNLKSYGDPFQITGKIQSVKAIDERGLPLFRKDLENEPQNTEVQDVSNKIPVRFFQTRNMLSGFYIHFFSPDRGIIYYTPVILFGIFGLLFLYRKKRKITTLILAVIGVNILLYSMWGDPWGGWAFGSRYLIPSYALMSIFIAIALTKFSKNIIFILIFLLVTSYSISVNTLGALTSNTNPPKVEVLALEELSGHEEKYTYERNLDILMAGKSKSFVFQSFASRYVDALQYYLAVSELIVLVVGLQTIWLFHSGKKEAVDE